MDFVKLRRPFQEDDYGNTVSCIICTESSFTHGDIVRLKHTVSKCVENEPDDETFDEFVDRVVTAHNKQFGTNFSIVYPSYQVDI